MQIFFHTLFTVLIFNPSTIITESLKDVEKNYTSINKGKWHVGRVSRKQYEIINMLWKKTKIFIDTETTKTFNNSLNVINKYKRNKKSQHVTLVNQNPIQESFQLAKPKSKVYSSTASYIEFYYLDELEDRKRHIEPVKNKNKVITKFALLDKASRAGFSRSPFFLFRVNEATCKATTPYTSLSQHFVKWSTSKQTARDNKLKKSQRLKPSERDKFKKSTKSIHNSLVKSKRNNTFTVSLPANNIKTTLLKQETYQTSNKGFLDIMKKYISASETTTAANDHIRFFDIYDSGINTPYTFIDEDEEKMENSNTIQDEKRINLHQVDDTLRYNEKNYTRYVKKHVLESKDQFRKKYEFYNFATTDHLIQSATIATTNRSHLTLWSEFPFVAVYVYEPTQVRCDSASISPHWLVASATCLNRHHKDIKAEGRSAFVAYCSGNWRHPGRIAYVKQSLIHPRFHPKDNSRRQLYNIGAIQVVNSMADTCNGWAPISLMSHQFTAAKDGTLSTALGWGLDRYDTRHSLTELPKYLTTYDGLVYSDSCPGNTGYSIARRLDEESVKNVYCLSLPPYTEEENDAVHGSILLIGGKLIALYMQEERRRRGNQSAQYTGIWHLIPWLLDVAREPDDLDPFSLEM